MASSSTGLMTVVVTSRSLLPKQTLGMAISESPQTHIDRHEICQKITSPDFQAKNFTPLISQNFNSFGDKNTKKMSENRDIYTASKNFTLPPAVTAGTNLTSAPTNRIGSASRNFSPPLWIMNSTLVRLVPIFLISAFRKFYDTNFPLQKSTLVT